MNRFVLQTSLRLSRNSLFPESRLSASKLLGGFSRFSTMSDSSSSAPSLEQFSLDQYDRILEHIRMAPTESILPVLNQNHSFRRAISVRSNDINVLASPMEFYERLLQRIESSKDHIIISSLYLGTGELETSLVNLLHKRMKECPTLKVDFLFDYLRGSRLIPVKQSSSSSVIGEVRSHTDVAENGSQQAVTSTVHLLSPLLNDSSIADRVNLSLFHVPPPKSEGILRCLLERELNDHPKAREALAVHHMKFYSFDDEAIISGANLSDTYFTDRKDRYVSIRNQSFVNFLGSVVASIKTLPNAYRAVGIGPNPEDFKLEQLSLNSPATSEFAQSQLLPQFYSQTPAQLAEGCDTLIFPSIQLGSLGITHDFSCTKKLLSFNYPSYSNYSIVSTLATGYMNLSSSMIKFLVNTPRKNPFFMIFSSKEANGWFESKRKSEKYIPLLYEHSAFRIISKIRSEYPNFFSSLDQNRIPNLSPNLFPLEWAKPTWSFHSKGFWLSARSSSNTSNTAESTALISMIGSSNYGLRSEFRDSELNFTILMHPGKSQSLSKQFCQEEDALLKDCSVLVPKSSPSKSNSSPIQIGQFSFGKKIAQVPTLFVSLLSKIASPYM